MKNHVQTQLQLDEIAKWVAQCDALLALLRYQQLVDRLQQKKAA